VAINIRSKLKHF